MARKLLPMICRLAGKPRAPISSNLLKPPCNKFISSPKNRKLGTKPNQKRDSLVARRMPFPANAKSSSHFLQFMFIIIAYFRICHYEICLRCMLMFKP